MQGPGSELQLVGSKVHAFDDDLDSDDDPVRPLHRGVYVGNRARAHLRDCRLKHGQVGLGVADGASACAVNCLFRNHIYAAGHVVGSGVQPGVLTRLDVIDCASRGNQQGFLSENGGSVLGNTG